MEKGRLAMKEVTRLGGGAAVKSLLAPEQTFSPYCVSKYRGIF